MEITACISTLQGDEIVKKQYSLYNQIEHAGIVMQLIVAIYSYSHFINIDN